jgi:hypothetical protein
MDEESRKILLEQINAIRDEASALGARLRDIPVAETIARHYLAAIAARCKAFRGVMEANDWE